MRETQWDGGNCGVVVVDVRRGVRGDGAFAGTLRDGRVGARRCV